LLSEYEELAKRVMELRKWVEEKIEELEGDVARLKELLTVIDGFLRREGFKPAVGIERPVAKEVHAIKNRSGRLMANAYVDEKMIVIIPAEDVRLSPDTPPFKSFFLGKVLGGMASSDEEDVRSKELSKDDVISYRYEEHENAIKRIVIENYRTSTRQREILSSIRWTFERMLEKAAI